MRHLAAAIFTTSLAACATDVTVEGGDHDEGDDVLPSPRGCYPSPRRFGFGDASRADLLEVAGAHHAKDLRPKAAS